MYCWSCGGVVKQNLSFCNQCGARLQAGGDSTTSQDAVLISLIWAMVGVFVGGLGVLIGLISVLKKFGFEDGVVNGYAAASFMTILAVEFCFVWLLSTRIRRPTLTNAFRPQEPPRALPTENVIADPAGGVTEHTTHKLVR